MHALRGDARGGQEDERKGAGASVASSNHGGATRLNRTRASRVGVRIPIRCGSGDSGSLSGCERGRADTKSGCLVRGRAPSKPGGKVALLARESKADGRRKANRRSWRSSNGAASRRCSRVTTALRGRVDFRMALPGVYALVRHGAEGRHPRRGAPKSGAGVATKKAFALSSREVVAGREARNHGVHRIDSY